MTAVLLGVRKSALAGGALWGNKLLLGEFITMFGEREVGASLGESGYTNIVIQC